jgi:hypothetical protein
MVTTRTSGKDKDVFKKYYEEIVDRFGADFTRTRETITRDGLGNVTATSSVSVTIKADFQRIQDEKELQSLGVAGVGSAKLYAKTGADIQERDTVTVNSEFWLVKRRIEDDEFENTGVSEVWLLIRLDG